MRLYLFSSLLFAATTVCGAYVCATAARDHGDGPTIAMPGSLAGKVIHVDDGDTLIVLDDKGFKRVIRLTDIDAPEAGHGRTRPGQPYSAASTAHLVSLALGQAATANCFDIDARRRDDGTMRERYICRVFVNATDINMAMVDAGLAMAYRHNRRYVRDPATYAHEDAAKAARKGLWRQPAPTPPWHWRRACWEQQQCDGAAE